MSTVLEASVAKIPWIVDLDAHVVEPPDVWSSRLPAHLRDAGPHIEYMPGGCPSSRAPRTSRPPGPTDPTWPGGVTRITGRPSSALSPRPASPADEVVLKGVTYDEMRPGCWQPKARLEDMSVNGVEAQLCFPNYPRFCGQQFLWGKDRTLALLCVEAYNDWMVEEWCGSSDGRLAPALSHPALGHRSRGGRSDTKRCARCAGRRLQRASDLPGPAQHLFGLLGSVVPGLPGVRDRRLYARGFGTKTPQTSPDAPDAVPATILFGNSIGGMSDFMFSGCSSASPSSSFSRRVSDRLDPVPARTSGRRVADPSRVEQLPVVLSRATVHLLLPADLQLFLQGRGRHGLLDLVGPRNVVFETDYPHQDGTWPHSVEAAAEQFGHKAPEVVNRLARGNAIELLGLDLPLVAPRVSL